MYQKRYKNRFDTDYSHLNRFKNDFYVCSVKKYDNSLGLYDIEKFYIVNRICSFDFIVYEVVVLDNDKKIVYLRRYDDDMMFKIIIPKLKKIYIDKDIYYYQNVYYWKSKKGIRKVITSDTLYNRHMKRFYKVGDINKYGHKLIKISYEGFYRDTIKELYQVGLNVNDRFIKCS